MLVGGVESRIPVSGVAGCSALCWRPDSSRDLHGAALKVKSLRNNWPCKWCCAWKRNCCCFAHTATCAVCRLMNGFASWTGYIHYTWRQPSQSSFSECEARFLFCRRTMGRDPVQFGRGEAGGASFIYTTGLAVPPLRCADCLRPSVRRIFTQFIARGGLGYKWLMYYHYHRDITSLVYIYTILVLWSLLKSHYESHCC